MKAATRPTLISQSDFERTYGIDRAWLRGFVQGAGIKTYRGPRGAVCLDDAGRKAVLKAAVDLRLISA